MSAESLIELGANNKSEPVFVRASEFDRECASAGFTFSEAKKGNAANLASNIVLATFTLGAVLGVLHFL